ncbi:MAG: CRTAC1 family protein [Vicinamibacterales bacterium]
MTRSLAASFPVVIAIMVLSLAGARAQRGDDPPFTPVQADLLAMPHSLSNAWGDYDNDGDLDLAVSLGSGEVRLYRNDAGVLTSVGPEAGMPQPGGQEFRGLSWGDLDGDGFIDLVGGATEKTEVSVVLHNDGGKRFRNIADTLGLTVPNRSARQTNLVDYDNDGDLDVYATDRAGDNHLFRNDGARFTPVFAGAGPTDGRATVGACWLDMDEDGDLDLFLANQAGGTDAMWRNDGASFTDVAAAIGVAGPPRTPEEGGVGCAIGDFDNDGDFDIFVPNYGHNQLYRRNADGTYTDVAPQLGLAVENHAVGADWGDIDNDGDLDLSVMSYEGPVGQQAPANALFRNDGPKGFVNVLTKASPLNLGDHGVQLVDYDLDGALDLSLTDGYTEEGGHFLFRNTMPDEAKRRSLSVLVLDARGHHTRFGAEVRIKDASGRVLASRQVLTGGGYNTQRAAPVHVGLTSLAPVTVEVTFMGAHGRHTQQVTGVKPEAYAGRSLVVRETP